MLSKIAVRALLILLLAPVAHAQVSPTPSLQPSVAALNRMQIYAAQALADVEQSRTALHDGAAAQVASDLDNTRTLLELIRSRMPAAEFHAMLRAVRAVMDFQDNKRVLPLFPKLFYALDDLPPSTAVDSARRALKRAEKALRQPNRAAALHALEQADADFSNPLLTPPLDAAQRDLTTAFTALTSNRGNLTDSDLKKLAADLISLHKALATYPLDMSSNGH